MWLQIKPRKERLMKLEELLGAELYAQVQAKIDEKNKDEADKLKHIRYADLSEGEYVGKGKHDALQAKYDSQSQELTSANELIEQLKKDSKGNEEMQSKISAYKEQAEQLQAELAETKLKSAVKVALLSEKAVDVDYLTFKLNESLKEKGETLELDDNDNIKGWDSRLETLKTAYPSMFNAGEGGNGNLKPIENSGLPKGKNNNDALTREELLKKPYAERMELYSNNPEAYKAAMNS